MLSMSIHATILAEAADEQTAVSFHALQTQTAVSTAGAQAMFVDTQLPAVTLFCVGGIMNCETAGSVKPRAFCLIDSTDYASATARLSKVTRAADLALAMTVVFS